jgi:hypothetical protein
MVEPGRLLVDQDGSCFDCRKVCGRRNEPVAGSIYFGRTIRNGFGHILFISENS